MTTLTAGDSIVDIALWRKIYDGLIERELVARPPGVGNTHKVLGDYDSLAIGGAETLGVPNSGPFNAVNVIDPGVTYGTPSHVPIARLQKMLVAQLQYCIAPAYSPTDPLGMDYITVMGFERSFSTNNPLVRFTSTHPINPTGLDTALPPIDPMPDWWTAVDSGYPDAFSRAYPRTISSLADAGSDGQKAWLVNAQNQPDGRTYVHAAGAWARSTVATDRPDTLTGSGFAEPLDYIRGETINELIRGLNASRFVVPDRVTTSPDYPTTGLTRTTSGSIGGSTWPSSNDAWDALEADLTIVDATPPASTSWIPFSTLSERSTRTLTGTPTGITAATAQWVRNTGIQIGAASPVEQRFLETSATLRIYEARREQVRGIGEGTFDPPDPIDWTGVNISLRNALTPADGWVTTSSGIVGPPPRMDAVGGVYPATIGEWYDYNFGIWEFPEI